MGQMRGKGDIPGAFFLPFAGLLRRFGAGLVEASAESIHTYQSKHEKACSHLLVQQLSPSASWTQAPLTWNSLYAFSKDEPGHEIQGRTSYSLIFLGDGGRARFVRW